MERTNYLSQFSKAPKKSSELKKVYEDAAGIHISQPMSRHTDSEIEEVCISVTLATHFDTPPKNLITTRPASTGIFFAQLQTF